MRSSQSRPSGRGSPPGFAPGSFCCSSGMLYPRKRIPSSGSSRDVSHSTPCRAENFERHSSVRMKGFLPLLQSYARGPTEPEDIGSNANFSSRSISYRDASHATDGHVNSHLAKLLAPVLLFDGFQTFLQSAYSDRLVGPDQCSILGSW